MKAGDKGKFPRHHNRDPRYAAPGARVDSASATSGAAQLGAAAATPRRPQRSVATWTCQEGRAPPLSYASQAPWSGQRQVVPGQSVVPYPFRGHTISEHDGVSGGAHLPLPGGAECCGRCGQVVIHKSHYSGRLHPEIEEEAGSAGKKPTTASAAELPDAALAALYWQRMAADPGFAALVSKAGSAVRMAGTELAPRPPTPRQQPEQHDRLLCSSAGRAAHTDGQEAGPTGLLEVPSAPRPGEFSGVLPNFL